MMKGTDKPTCRNREEKQWKRWKQRNNANSTLNDQYRNYIRYNNGGNDDDNMKDIVEEKIRNLQLYDNDDFMCYLPQEVWDMILPNLPVKTLTRFRCVCKTWKFIIEEPNFVYAHHSRCYKNNMDNDNHRCLIIENPLRNVRRRWTIRHGDKLVRDYELVQSHKFAKYNVRDYLGGLALLCRDFNSSDSIVLLNPSIGKYVELPPFRRVLSLDSVWRFGLGYDNVSADYKVVVATSAGTAVCSLRTRSWKSINFQTRPSVPPRIPLPIHGLDCGSCMSYPVFLKGSIHWIGARDHPSLRHRMISFNIYTEAFTFHWLPLHGQQEETPEDMRRWSLAVLGDEQLAAIDVHWNEYYAIWELKECDNKRFWKLLRQSREVKFGRGDFIHLKRNGKLIILHGLDEIKSNGTSTKLTKTRAASRPPEDMYIGAYVESLVLCTEGTDCTIVKAEQSKTVESRRQYE